MDPRASAHLARQHGLITAAQALEAGLERREVQRAVRDGSWVRVRSGVYADAATWAAADEFRGRPLLRVHAAHLILRPEHWFSHDSAALLHGLPLADARRSLVHLTRPGVRGSRTVAGIKHHRAPFVAGREVVVAGLRVLPIARTALDLAREHDLAAGVAAMDAALRSGVRRAELEAELETMWCWPGSRTVRRAIELADPGAESWLESAGRMLVLEIGAGAPETQFGLTDGDRTVWCDLRLGRHVFEVDGAVKLMAVEHGGLAADPSAALRAEKRRQDFISGFKLGVSRITYADCLPHHRAAAVTRLRREYADTLRRYGSDVSDLAAYTVRGRRPVT